MRRFFVTLTITLFSVVVAFAEGPPTGKGPGKDDHDGKAPIQSGYAVITPATTSGTGLVVFETFGWRRGGDAGTPQAGVLPPDLTTNAVMFVDSKGKLSKDLGLAMVNPNTSNTNVSVTLRGSDGKQLGTKTVNVPSHQQTVTFLQKFLPTHPSVQRTLPETLPLPTAVSL